MPQGIDLVKGKAFSQPHPPEGLTTDEDCRAMLVDCMKCPACGYSEELSDGDGKTGGRKAETMYVFVRRLFRHYFDRSRRSAGHLAGV